MSGHIIRKATASGGVLRIRLGVLAANTAARAAYEPSGLPPHEIVYEKVVCARDEPSE
jgi:hypothetical protein